MAKTTKNRKKKGAHKKQQAETRRWVAGVVLFLFGLFLLIAVGGYFFSWQSDQTFANWESFGDNDIREVRNPAGRTGARMVAYLVGDWFGIFGIVVPIAFIIIGIQLLQSGDRITGRVLRMGFIMFAVTILGSLSLGLLFPDSTMFGSGPGGAHGKYISGELHQYVGFAGTGLLLVLAWILLGLYINRRRTMSIVNGVGRGIYEGGTLVGEAVREMPARLHGRDEAEEADENDIPDDSMVEEKPGDPIKPNKHATAAERVVDEKSDNGRINENKLPPRYTPPADSVVHQQVQPAVSENDFVVTDVRGMDEEPVREVAPEPPKPRRDVMWDDEPVDFMVRRESEKAKPASFDGDAYAGGVGGPVPGAFSTVAATAGAIKEQLLASEPEQDQKSGIHRDGAFTVTDLPAPDGAVTLKPGGVLEGAGTSAGSTASMKVVAAGRSDIQLEDNDIDDALYDPTKELSRYQKPPVEILEDHSIDVQVTEDEIYENKNQIVRTLENFGIRIDKIKATIGPTVTLYEIIPAAGVKISKIKNLEDDIALSLKALGIRIIAPMPGKGTVGIEVPNKDKEIVSMYSVVKTRKFQESTYELPVVLGKTISNETMVIDLAAMPHLLVAGATGQGKSVGLNAIITSLLYRKHPAELKFVLVDPKRVELSLYGRLEKHFLAKMESEDDAILTDTQKVVYTLNALCNLMSERYDLLRMAEVKKISEYNAKFLKRRLNPKKGHKFMPYIVVVIDEFADMIMTAGREVEAPITRLAQLARAVGIHLVIATQRPDVKVITGLIKANFPARVAFRVTSMVDSRTILDQPGANQLIGRGDMLFSLNGEVTRVQCAFIDTPEIERITEFIGNQKGYPAAYDLPDYHPEGDAVGKAADLGQLDSMFGEVARAVVQAQEFSTSWIQRNYGVGYNRAGRITDQLEKAGIIGKANGSKPREVLVYDMMALEAMLQELGAS